MDAPTFEEQVTACVEQITAAIRGQKTVEEAARRLRLIVSGDIVNAAVEKYRLDAMAIWKLREPAGILNPNFEPWYPGPDPADRLWPSYEQLLVRKKWGDSALKDLDSSTTRIVSGMWPPGTPEFKTRGLVVGHVQSGKTANFAGVIAKAADVGYKLVIVLSGLTDALRAQTQERLEQDLVHANTEHWNTLTSLDDDFKISLNVNSFLSQHHGVKVLGVLKKNSARLNRLLSWLTGAKPEVLRSCPILIIDDEADQATPNAHPNPGERTAINLAIVGLLGQLPRVAYVGYTATPFANLLIDPSIEEDLYPRDFIIDLPRAEGYFGAEQIHGRPPLDYNDEAVDGIDVIRVVPDAEAAQLKPLNRAARTTFIMQITPSLREAALYFWLATAARAVRGHVAEHSTMLVHTTQYALVHVNARPVVEQFRDSVLADLRRGVPAMRDEMRNLWESEQSALPSGDMGLAPVAFDDLQSHLQDVLARTLVRAENGSSADRIDYRTAEEGRGRIYIIIGGNILARGLTLYGLVVSLFTRTASAYDTLLQMGRWFGYRPGYADLPRVWMTDELRGFFYDMAAVEHEIRIDIARYQHSNLTPLDFAVKIRTHPRLAITSDLKMQAAVRAKIDFSGREVQTIVFRYKQADWLRSNLEATRKLIASLRATDKIEPIELGGRPHKVFVDVPASRILEFLREYEIDNSNSEMPKNLLIAFIKDQIRLRQRLTNWNVAVVTVDSPKRGMIDLGLNDPIALINRSRFDRRRRADLADIKALMSEIDVAADVDVGNTALRGEPRDKLRQLRDQHHPRRGLLLLYPIAKDSMPQGTKSSSRLPLAAEEHVIGIALVFPDAPFGEATPQSYMTADLSAEPREEVTEEDLGETEP